MHFSCATCSKRYEVDTFEYRCECGGLFKLEKSVSERIETTISLGEVVTPIINRTIDGVALNLKIDYTMPTGSFKDRGAHVLINHAVNIGVKEVVEDSSGNAAASIAAYCAAAGIKCHIYLPAHTSAGKIKQIAAYGANIVKIEGTRDDTAKATLEAAKKYYYASHVYNPLFFEGTKTLGKEIIEQLWIPDWVVCPVGNGTMLIGIYNAFKEAGKMPKILAVQSAACTPVYTAFHKLDPRPASVTIAEGIAVGEPMRKQEMINIIEESGGTVITVTDSAVEDANKKLGLSGIYCEPTSAASVAGAVEFFKGKKGLNIVVPISGSGLKKG